MRISYARELKRYKAESNVSHDPVPLVSVLRDIFYLLENYHLRVRRFFEKYDVPDPENPDFLDQITSHEMEAMGALFAMSLVEEIDELSDFRDSTRKTFKYKVDSENVEWLKEEVPEALDIFTRRHNRVVSVLQELFALFPH